VKPPGNESFARFAVRTLVGSETRRKIELQKIELQKFFYRQPIEIHEMRDTLLSLGNWRNRTVFVQSSWNQFYNAKFKPLELIDLMLELVGPQGTLVMPTHPLVLNYGDILYVDAVPSSSGLLTELFRRKRDAKRSVHISSAVSALGPMSEMLINEHHLDIYPWGPKTPFGKMIDADALLVLLGTVPMGFTPLHYVECVLHRNYSRYDGVFKSQMTYVWIRKDGTSGEHTFYQRNGRIQPWRIRRYFDNDVYRSQKLSNLTVQAFEAKRGISRAVDLAKSGITIYSHLSKS
jgi:aminoglycoside N3'-acetyltransferase